MKVCLSILFVFVCHWITAQIKLVDNIDSLQSGVQARLDSLRLPGDSTRTDVIQKANAIKTDFQHGVDSLQGAYTSSLSRIDALRVTLQTKIDSLTNLGLPSDKVNGKLDSLTKQQSQEFHKATQKLEQLKTKASQSLSEVNLLAPELQGPMTNLKESIHGYSMPGFGQKMPIIDFSQLGFPKIELHLPPASAFGKDQLNLLEKMRLPGDLTQSLSEVKGLTGRVGEYGKEINNISSQAAQIKDIDKAIDTQVSKLSEVQGMKMETAGFGELTGTGGLDEEAIKQKIKQAATQEAMAALKEQVTDHFAGKEEVLKKAMSSISKLKSKYSEVKSLSEIPKRVPNPMKGKPLIERIVPGLTFLIQKKDVLLLDVNPVMRFRFTGRFTAGLGWNQRLVFDKWNLTDRTLIYGPRAVAEYKWGKGFYFLVSPEAMSTSIPPQLQRTPIESNKVWVAGMFGGLKNEFVVYKKIKGNSEMLYNLINQHGRSPYADRFVVRFGFELPMKKSK